MQLFKSFYKPFQPSSAHLNHKSGIGHIIVYISSAHSQIPSRSRDVNTKKQNCIIYDAVILAVLFLVS